MPIRSKLKRKNKSRTKSKQIRRRRSRRISKLKKQTRKRYRKSNKKNRKTNRRYKKYNKNKQKGGFYFGTRTDANKMILDEMDSILNEYFNHIFKNNIVTIEPLGSEGIYGIIFVIKFKNSYLQSLKDTDFAIRDYNKNPSKRILVKIVYVDPSLRGMGSQNERDIGSGSDAKRVVSREAFDYEVKIQQHVFKRTNSHLQPITPLIYYNAVHNSNDSKKLFL